MSVFRAACIQMNTGDDVAANVAVLSAEARKARDAGADFIATPENCVLMPPDNATRMSLCRYENADPALPPLCALARELGVWLLIGSIAIKIRDDRLVNRSFLIGPDGAIAARYDKIHLFDADLPDGERYRESSTVENGGSAITAELPWGRIGLTVCYDVRFPKLYRALAHAGAFALSVPAAFTETTGRAHWHVLTRARAIENGAYVIAPAQCGVHPGGRRTFGHSLIVSPWGEVLADGGEAPGIIRADIDPAKSLEARARIPSLMHDRDFA
jgi:deaminated glutathione amidase